MSYRVSINGFEGPFDLLLTLVTRQKVDIGAVSVSEIAQQYLDEVGRLVDLDLDVASDFVYVASSLLQLKAASLVDIEVESSAQDEDGDDEDLTPEELREVLIARLIEYRTFKSAARALESRGEAEARMHPRVAGPDPEFIGVLPDYLKNVPLVTIAQACARLDGRRERMLLESEHIAAKRMPLETRVEQVDEVVRRREHLTFDELVSEDPSVQNRVVSILALLELDKRHALSLTQRVPFGTILIDRVADAPAFDRARDADGLTIDRPETERRGDEGDASEEGATACDDSAGASTGNHEA